MLLPLGLLGSVELVGRRQMRGSQLCQNLLRFDVYSYELLLFVQFAAW